MWANATQNAKDRLNQKWRLDQATVNKMRGSVEMPNVITLDLESRFVVAAGLQDVCNIFEGVFKHAVITVGKIRHFPVMLKGFEALEHVVQTKVHRTHVQRGDFWLEVVRGAQALGNRHSGCTACGEVDHHIAFLFDLFQKRREQLGVLRGAAVNRIACMQMHNRSTCFGSAQCGICNFFGSYRQMR